MRQFCQKHDPEANAMKREVAARRGEFPQSMSGHRARQKRAAQGGAFRPVMRPFSHRRQCAKKAHDERGEAGFGCPKYPAAEFRIFYAIM